MWGSPLLLYLAHCGILFGPSFVSTPPRDISVGDPPVTIPHHLNEVPAKVLAEVTVDLDGAGQQTVFNAFGSAQRDATTGITHGGIVCLYNTTHVVVYAPTSTKGRLFYPGTPTTFRGPTFPDYIKQGTVVVRAWRAFDFPKPDYYKDWTNIDVNDNTTTFLELEHGIGGYPDLVVVQIKGDNSPDGLISEASGAISVFNTRTTVSPADQIYFGGVMFGYSDNHIRIWAPNQDLSDNKVTLYYVRNGWGMRGYPVTETTGKIRVMAWKFDNESVVQDKKLTLNMMQDQNPIDIDDQSGLPWNDSQLLLVQSGAIDQYLPNNGFWFTGIGSAMTEGQDGTFGGLIYGRNGKSILVWIPNTMSHETFKSPLCIHKPWGTESTRECRFGGLNIRAAIYNMLSIDDVRCIVDQTVDDFVDSTQSVVQTSLSAPAMFNETLDLTCQSGLVYISGDNFMYCSRDGIFESDARIVCLSVQCPDPELTPNARLPTSSGTTLGDAVTYTCKEGYILDDPSTATRTCQQNSTWSGELPDCRPITCPTNNISALFASHTSTGNVFLANVTYQCDVGFPYQSGNLVRTCMADGAWSGSAPVCEYCECPCSGDNSFNTLNMTLAELLAALRAELKVDKKTTSIALRKKISVYEDRTMAKGLGSIGIAMLVFVFAIVIIPDVPRLFNDLRNGLHNLFSCCSKAKSHNP